MSSTSNWVAESPTATPAIAPACATPAQRLAAFVRRRWAAYWDEQARRTVVRMLRELDDRTLRDIGLTRSEIRRAVYGEDAATPLTRRCQTSGV